MLTDLEISNKYKKEEINKIAQKINIEEKYIENYGKYKAKIKLEYLDSKENKNSKLILVTAISPTPAGEGKTTTTIGLADALRKIKKNSSLALREPSLGPVFGIKGGATGGGYAQVVPMEEINLHFNGDIHAISAANNLLAAILDNHIYQGNLLNIDPSKVLIKRCIDMNDRQLRNIVSGLGGKTNGRPREDGFEITVRSEVMAILCLSISIKDLKNRLSKITVAYTYDNKPITCKDLKADGAMTVLLKEAIKPNLVQTLEGTPAFIHGGPFANIAHGCNSILATKMALLSSEYVVTEAGFGADLGAEKFFDIKCRIGNIKPNAVVIVATVRALKMHGGLSKNELSSENIEALKKGIVNLIRHIKNIQEVFKISCCVAINKFPTDTEKEIEYVKKACSDIGIKAVLSTVWENGGDGAIELANEVIKLCDNKNNFSFCYENNITIKEKIESIVKNIYGGKKVNYSKKANIEISNLETLGYSDLPICIAKTQYSFSDDSTKLGAPNDFEININNIKISSGAGFIVAFAGDIMAMPGLPRIPQAENINITDDGETIGLF